MYNHKEIEKKWQIYWEKNKVFKTLDPIETDLNWILVSEMLKYYCLDMFPYPSGAWLHVWHPEWYTANDIMTRYKKACWYNVLHPMWWDAFWLPAENYAIKTWTHPRLTTDKNIKTFKEQIKSLWFSYDRDREIDTTDPEYYKWTQWIFLKLFEKGLAYEQDLPINYCPHCKTWVANEEVLNDFTHERCGNKVEKKKIRQWVLAITKYADRLLNDVDKLDWPEGIKDMQRNRIWKSEGCEFEMKKSDDETKSIRVYTTRIDTVFGMTYAVLAPDHKDIDNFISSEEKEACLKYIEKSKKKPDQDRISDNKEKTWVFTWSYVINPFNAEKVPLWIADYVLGNYGTWAVMAVPAHDERDFEFAKKYWIDINQSIWSKIYLHEDEDNWIKAELHETGYYIYQNIAYTEYWILVNSWEFSWLKSEEAKIKLTEYAEQKWFWEKKVNYKLRDWLFSRQRYWGEPIPLIHLELEQLKKLPHISSIKDVKDKNLAYILKRDPEEWESSCDNTTCSWKVRELVIWGKVFSKIYDWLYGKIVCDYNLPLELPEVNEYEPAWDWQSPLVKVKDFVNVKLADNLEWKRETNTMPQWGWSCWYYLRYMDPKNPDKLVDPKVEKYWGQVDSYVWWAEHAVLHLLYARFWHKFLYDIWVVSSDEPFYRLRNQWLILSYAFQRKNGWLVANDLVEEKNWRFYEKETWKELDRIIAKMSKSLKNVVNPDEIIKEYWADSLRLYEMYMADFKDSAPWDSKNIIWVRRFLDRVYSIYTWELEKYSEDDNLSMKMLHKTIKKVWEDIENYKFNTAIAQMMICINEWTPKDEELNKEWKEAFLILLHPFAPHMSEELWSLLRPVSLNETGLSKRKSIFFASWPKYDENLVKDDTITIWVQVLWKLRWEIEIWTNEDKDSVIKKAKENESIKKWIVGKEIVKEIYVPWKIVNIVIKGDDTKKDKIINNDKRDKETEQKKEYKRTDYKFVAILNKKIEVWKIMNALAHMTAWMVWNSKNLEEMWFINYEDKDNSPHMASKHPFIILKAKNSNQIRQIRSEVIERWLVFSSFTSAMTVGNYEQQLEESKKQWAEDLEYYWLSIFWKKEIVDEITKRLSLWV